MPHAETCLSSREIYSGRVISVSLDTARLEDGSDALREIVHHHGGACVLAVTADEEIYMVRQFRYAFQEELWELPAGKLEADEDPFEAAKRELTEECGITADTFTALGQLYPTVGYDTEKIYTWIARGIHQAEQHLDEDEFLDVHKIPFAQAYAMVMDNTIRDAKTVAGILKYALLRETLRGAEK